MVVVKKTNNIINFQDALNVFTPIFFSSTHPVIRDPTSAQTQDNNDIFEF